MNDVLSHFSSYDNQLLAEYKVQCSPGQLAFINITVMDIEEANCIDLEGNSRQVLLYLLCLLIIKSQGQWHHFYSGQAK